MKFTVNWLRDHLETAAPLDTIVARLTMLGLEVEEVADPGERLHGFRVATVLTATPHPQADRLRICLVDAGDGPTQVICGAPNARAGMKGVFAGPGAHIPGTGIDLKVSTIRGVESRGMLLSERELGLSDEHAGIIELPVETPVGTPAATALGLDDAVITIGLTPDRADCTGVRGIARDLAAAGLGRLLPYRRLEPLPGRFDSPLRWQRDLGDHPEACPFVAGRCFRNVRNGSSPKWLQDRLRAIGLRPISALVDITNHVTFDLGRPLHAFDADKLAGDLTMRFARTGERVDALNGKTYELDATMVVIADATGALAIGGIMGGAPTGCTAETRNVFLEVALFDPLRTAATGRRLQIESDARYRFERGVDPLSGEWGAEAAAHFVAELCGGEASQVVTAGAIPPWQRQLTLRPHRVFALGGLEQPAEESKATLDRLEFATSWRDGVIAVVPPSWRADVEGEADLVEEVVRVAGFDQVPAVPMPALTSMPRPALDRAQRRVGRVKRALGGRGLLEAVTWSFMDRATATLFGGGDPALTLANPISADLDQMRPSILPNLLGAARRNADRGFPDVALFELGPHYEDDTAAGQHLVAAGVRVGRTGPRHWATERPSREAREVDAFDAKADLLAALAAIGAPTDGLQISTDAPAWYHPGRCGAVRLGAAVIGWFGELNPGLLGQLAVKGAAVGFELFLDRVPLPKAKGPARPPLRLSPFQPLTRDFAFVVAADVPADKLVRSVKSADRALITEVSVFDVYVGQGIEPGRKSVALAVTLQPTERTLTEAEIEAVAAKIVANVIKQTGAVLRGG